MGSGKPAQSSAPAAMVPPHESPSGAVSSLCWAPASLPTIFAVGSWDGGVRLHQVDPGSMALQALALLQCDGPVLCASLSETLCFAGCVGGQAFAFDLATQAKTQVGQHEGGLRCTQWVPGFNVLMTAGWDRRLKLWDVSRQQAPALDVALPERAYAAAVLGQEERRVPCNLNTNTKHEP